MKIVKINEKYRFAHSICKNENSQPWRHFVFDDFLEESCFTRIQREILDDDYKFKVNSDDPEKIQHSVLTHLPLIRFFMSRTFSRFVIATTGKQHRLFFDGAIQLRRMDESSPEFPLHHDFIDNFNLIVLYYLSPNWRKGKGGELILQKTKRQSSELTNSLVIEPKANRLVFLFAAKNHWHRVNRVKNWNRYLVFSEWTPQ